MTAAELAKVLAALQEVIDLPHGAPVNAEVWLRLLDARSAVLVALSKVKVEVTE